MKNYYEILQVNENATKEIISKVYKVLAKKYHPDANPDNKEEASEKFKEISEAYEVLSDKEKKMRYDQDLKAYKESMNGQTVSLEKFTALQNYCYELERKLNINSSSANYQSEGTNNTTRNTNNHSNTTSGTYENIKNYAYKKERQRAEKQAYHDAVNRVYHDAYVNNLKNMGYKVKKKKTFKETVKGYLAVALTVLIMFVLIKIIWSIPFVKEWFYGLFSL